MANGQTGPYSVPARVDTDPSQPRLDYRSGNDARLDDARAMRRSVRTWAILSAVWVIGLAVWAAYLVGMGYVFLRWLS